jgi:pyruvate/2-oxoglutarate dehydrogenase complex dihydrolipoamide dehydrogenase (E3) component
MTEYDLIVLGAGASGENVADRAVQDGLTAVLVEAELVGGECSYWACMPSKALLRPGSARRAALSVAGAKQAVTADLDVSAVLDRRTSFAHSWSDESQVKWAEETGIALVRGRARFTGPREVTVTGADGSTTTLTARHAVCVSTGSDPTIPPLEGLHDVAPWTSREATSARTVPSRLVILGGGVVAAEMATAYADLGSRVTVLVRSGLLDRLEPFAGELVAGSLRSRGVDLRLGASARSFSRGPDGVTVELSDGSRLTADEVLVATGRSPRTGDLGVETIGLEPGKPLETDDTMLVHGFDWLYATGDVTSRALLTHQGKYQARAAGDAIAARAAGRPVDDAPWGAHVATADARAVPQVTFTDPEVASVGLTAAEAEKAGLRTRVIDYELGDVSGASVFADGYRGQARMVVDEAKRTVVGATFAGPGVGELLHSATIAVVGEVPIDRLWHAVPSYPTISEVWLRLLEAYGRPGQPASAE